MQYKIFGCKTNKYFTEKWLNTKFLDEKLGVFVASCIVTDKAKAKWIKYVGDTIKNFKDADEKIYLSGCGTIKKGSLVDDFYTTYPELTVYKDRIVLLGEDPEKDGIKEKIELFRKNILFTRKYLIIQNGCDNYCTFCLTIQARGKHFSRDIDSIIDEILEFEKCGGKEVVITGTNIGAWGTSDTKRYHETQFPNLISEIISRTKVPRIRISSLGIEYINDDLIELFKNSRVYPHFHLSIQSGSDNILKKMNRNYNKKTLEDTLSKIRLTKRDDGIIPSVGADFIVGFPGEKDFDFDDTISLINKYSISKLHAFPFSAHHKSDFIPASRFDEQIPERMKKERMKIITEVGNKIREEFLQSNDGKTLNLLVEKSSSGTFSGWSENYIGLNELNFKPLDGKLIRGELVKGIYSFKPGVEKFDEEL